MEVESCGANLAMYLWTGRTLFACWLGSGHTSETAPLLKLWGSTPQLMDTQQWLAIVELGGELQGVALSQDFPTNFGWRGSTYPAGIELVWPGVCGLWCGRLVHGPHHDFQVHSHPAPHNSPHPTLLILRCKTKIPSDSTRLKLRSTGHCGDSK